MTLSIIAAIGKNNELGKNNQLLWHISEDLKRFKQLTSGHTMIMGRKTFDSIGRPLPNRRSIVISRQKDLQIEGCEVVHSLEEALSLCNTETEVFIIGGAEIYKQSIDIADKIYLTRVEGTYEADAWFPEIHQPRWKAEHIEQKEGYQFIDLINSKS